MDDIRAQWRIEDNIDIEVKSIKMAPWRSWYSLRSEFPMKRETEFGSRRGGRRACFGSFPPTAYIFIYFSA